MTTKNKTDIIRVGDRVRITTPEIFVRCGYPLCVADVVSDLLTNNKKEIHDFLKSLGVKFSPTYFGDEAVDGGHFSPRLDKLLSEIAYLKIKSNRFGGRIRSIYTKSEPDYQDAIVNVVKTKVVRTGEYYAPSFHSSYDGDDYDCGGLSNSKSHKIVQFSRYGANSFFSGDEPWIEVKNVQKIKD